MKKSWRNIAVGLFLASLLFGGVAGDRILALTDEEQAQLHLYTELLHTVHEAYGEEVLYRDLVYASIHGMLQKLDPHTSFLTPEAYRSMRERQQGSFYGLGILVSMRNGQLMVISPIEGTPAWRLGLRAGDVISTIEGEATATMSLDEAVDKLKGPKGTQVNVAIVRRGLDEPLPLTITRAEIPQDTVRYSYMLTPETGYLRLTDFSRSTTAEMSKAIEKLEAEGMRQLILDLRSNGGGLLDQAVNVANLFVPDKSRIVETRGRTPDSYQSFYANGDYEPLDKPLVVLVNNGTASAAEILAGAVQDHDVGLVVGTPTWGKGLVQTVYNLSYDTGVALTTAKYYTPAGRLIQRDYSSYYDYYTHFSQTPPDAPAVPEIRGDQPEFATDLGRTVYGGGGITPDIEEELPDGPEVLQVLFAENAFFEFAVDRQSRKPVKTQDWRPKEKLLDDFHGWLIAEDIANAAELEPTFTNDDARAYVLRQLHADIFTAAFGPEAAHRVLTEGDTQIQAALELFEDAEALLLARRELDNPSQPRVAVRAPVLETADDSGGGERP